MAVIKIIDCELNISNLNSSNFLYMVTIMGNYVWVM